MQFKDVLNDIIELSGLELKSINPSTSPIIIGDFDEKKNTYKVTSLDNELIYTRTYKELNTIWEVLNKNGYVNIDQALYGGGSKRNQPETILANLPYIEHFKFDNKKHLYLNSSKLKSLGQLSELNEHDTELVCIRIKNYQKLNYFTFHEKLKGSINQLRNNLELAIKSEASSTILKDIEEQVIELDKLEKTLEQTLVSTTPTTLQYNELLHHNLEQLSFDDILDSPEVTGVDNGEDDDPNDDSTINQPSRIKEPSKSTPRIRQQTPSFSLITDRLEYGEIEIQPEYQRKDRIWKQKERSKLIESILLGLPLPIFYFAERENGDWAIIDGLQRITTLYDFSKGVFKLSNLEKLDSLNGSYFKDLERAHMRKINEFQLTSYVIDENPDDNTFISELFHRINTYGEKLSQQEIRNAINYGSSVNYLKYLSSSDEFIHSTDNKVLPKRQKDIELCLGAISYIIFGYKSYNNNYDDFLSQGMKWLNNHECTTIEAGNEIKIVNSSNFIDGFHKKITETLLFSHNIFEENTFKKLRISDRTTPISKPLFELITCAFFNLTEEQKTLLSKNKNKFVNDFYLAIEEDSSKFKTEWESDTYKMHNRGFNYSISQSTGKRVTVRYRFNAISEMINLHTDNKFDINPIDKEGYNDRRNKA